MDRGGSGKAKVPYTDKKISVGISWKTTHLNLEEKIQICFVEWV